MMQTIAIFVSAYRELSARRLFWLALAVSVIVVGIFACLGINEEGVSFLGWTFDTPLFNTNMMSPETFYKLLFVNLGVDWWLGVFAALLALVTTCGIIPDLVAPGSIDLLLAKPISRTRLFLTKYCTGLLFAALQVTVFTAATFVVIGARGGAWEWSLFIAVPIVTFFYSLLYCMCAFVGILTKSSVASLILTLLAWTVIFTINTAETIVNSGLIANRMEIAAIEAKLAAPEPSVEEDEIDDLRTDLATALEHQPDWVRAHFWFHGVKSCLPKTSDTLGLLERWMLGPSSMPLRNEEGTRGPQGAFGPRRVKRGEFELAIKEDEHSHSLWWVLGTSALFEVVVLAAATSIFVRRDY